MKQIGFRLSVLILTVFRTVPVFACSDCPEVPVKFYGNSCADSTYTVTLASATSTGNGEGRGCGYVESSETTAKLKPYQSYTMTVSGKLSTAHVKLDVESCYRLFIDGTETSVADTLNSNGCQTFSRSWSVMVKPSSTSGGPGTGGNGGGGLSSAHWSFSLGGLPNGGSAESILISQTELDADSYSPTRLLYVAPSPEVVVIRDTANALRQIKAPEVFADIVTVSASKYELRFYNASAAGPLSGGLYQPVGSPFVTWTVENPANSIPGEKLRISETRGGITTASEFRFAAATGSWGLIKGGLREETRDVIVLVNGDKQITTTVRNPVTGAVSSKRKEIRHEFPWGEETIKTIDDPDGAGLTTSYEFYTSVTQFGSYGRVKWVIRPDGSWEKYDYIGSTFNAGSVYRVYRPWKDGPAGPADAAFGNCRVTEFSYTSLGYGYSVFAAELSAEKESVLGVTTAYKSYYPYLTTVNGQPAISRTTYLYGKNVNQAVGQRKTVTYKSEAAQPYSGQVASSSSADGTKDSYSYEFGSFNVATGVFTAGAGSYSRQTQTRGTANSPSGIPNKTTRTVGIRDSGGRLLVEEEQIYTGSTYSPLVRNTHVYNPQGQLTETKRNGRIVYEAVWVDGEKKSETDETGVTTNFTYDGLDRVETETRAGITITYTYDADGRLLSTTRTGGTVALASATSYDQAGRVESETGEDGLVTAVSYTSGGRIETRTFATQGTRITERYLDANVKSVTGTAVVARYFDYGVDSDGVWTKESTAAANAPRWAQIWKDLGGRTARADRPGYTGIVTTNFSYNAAGGLTKVASTGEAPALNQYDDLGRLFRSGVDSNGNDTLDPVSADRLQQTDVAYEQSNGNWFRVTTQSQYETDGNGTATTISRAKEQLSGLAATIASQVSVSDRRGNTTTTTIAINRATQTVTETEDTPDSDLNAVRVLTSGRLASSNTTTVSQPTTFEYDELGRPWKSIDPRGVETVTSYQPGTGRVESVTASGKTTTYEYHPAGTAGAGQVKSMTNPDTTKLYYDYSLRGEQVRQWGSAAYPIETIYNQYGERRELRTFRGGTGWGGNIWPASPGTADVTTWTYQESTGLLISKSDAQSHPVNYTYTPSGKLDTRTWARGVVADYDYNDFGELKSVDYSDTTPDVTFGKDRAGRMSTISDAAGSHNFVYTPTQDTEMIAGGILGAATLSSAFDNFGRRSGFTLSTGRWSETNGYGYDPRSRLETVTSTSKTAKYTYLPNSDLVETTTFRTGGSTRLTTTRSWDASNRLKTITNAWTGGSQSFDVTQFDGMDRRKQITWGGGSKWDYGYNDRGEVTSGSRKWADGSGVLGQQYGYQFDNIGNRQNATVNGRTASYTPNSLNQYDDRTVPGAVDERGSASPGAAVTVNGASAQRQGSYFYKELAVDNSSAPMLTTATIAATTESGTTTRQSKELIPQTPENFTYDGDGNLTRDGLWNYTWDAENRLIAVESIAAVPLAAKRKLAFAYDAQGRRIRKQVWHWQQNGWLLHHTFRFVYDGWNLVAELTDTGRRVRTYTWGLDVSGTAEVAGGVGGLLFETNHFGDKSLVPTYDLNGNIAGLINLTDSAFVASYEYSPFGELIRSSGEYAALNPFQFSSKYRDDEINLVYYGARFYDQENGRFLNVDPKNEKGFRLLHQINTGTRPDHNFLSGRRAVTGENAYSSSRNDAINNWEYLGLEWHHLLPQGLFTDDFLKREGISDLNIHDQKYGWDLDFTVHRGKGDSVHAAGWNNDWRSWISSEKAAGRNITKCSIEKQLETMKGNYSDLLAKGRAVSGNYRSVKYKFVKGVGGTSVLLLFTLAAGEFTGGNAAVAEELQSEMEEYISASEEAERMIKAAIIADKAAALFGVPEVIILSAFIDKNGNF